MDDIIFELHNAGFTYPSGQPALAEVGLAIRRGDRLAILGANASGKSTLLHLLDGLYFASSGGVRACGRDLDEKALNDPDFRRFFRSEVALLFQNVDAQLFCASVEEDIAFGPLQLGLSTEETRRRIAESARLCEVESLLERPPHSLSGGEKKRVALASMLAVDPSVLLLDEPSAGLDPRTEVWLIEILDALSEAGKTVVVATHDLSFAAEFCDVAAALGEDHRLAAYGPPETILADYDLLLRLNLIHSHAHRHGRLRHVHPHAHTSGHEHRSDV